MNLTGQTIQQQVNACLLDDQRVYINEQGNETSVKNNKYTKHHATIATIEHGEIKLCFSETGPMWMKEDALEVHRN